MAQYFNRNSFIPIYCTGPPCSTCTKDTHWLDLRPAAPPVHVCVLHCVSMDFQSLAGSRRSSQVSPAAAASSCSSLKASVCTDAAFRRRGLTAPEKTTHLTGLKPPHLAPQRIYRFPSLCLFANQRLKLRLCRSARFMSLITPKCRQSSPVSNWLCTPISPGC